MKIALMSGAYVNAGDFLIEQRCKELLEANIPDAQIDVLKRNISYDDKIKQLNTYDLIVFGGGPGFQPNLYPNKMPFVSELRDVKTRMAVLGWGWKGNDIKPQTIYRNYRFTEKMLHFIKYISESGISLSCRDWYTVQMLREYGFHSLNMTGCPAWYNPLYIDNLRPKDTVIIQKICISDTAYVKNLRFLKTLITWARNSFPAADIKLLIHRGIHKNNAFLLTDEFLKRFQITYADISGSAAGFRLYDECDLHIGFRVHAHIYNLSMGNHSILINEDARGYGVNDALGIRNMPLENMPAIFGEKQVNFFEKQLADYWAYLTGTNFLQYEVSCHLLLNYYKTMCKYIKCLGEM